MSCPENTEYRENSELMDVPSQESSWADAQVALGSEPLANTDEPAAADHSDTEGDEFELPEALKNLINISGANFVAVPENTWNIDGWAAKLKRNFSVTFPTDIEVSSADILEALLKTDVDPETISAIQFRGSNRSWVVSFTDQNPKNYMLEIGRLLVKDTVVFLGDAEFKTVIVKIYEAPMEMPDTAIIGRLAHYGKVLSFRRDRGVSTGIFNDVRTARMRLSQTILSNVRIAGESIGISYPGQPKTCWKCGDEGHMAQGCKSPRCYNCEAPGHRAFECPEHPLCGICLESNHPISQCPFLVFSANVSNTGESTPSYADSVRQNQPAGPSTVKSAAASKKKTGDKDKRNEELPKEKTPPAQPACEGNERDERREREESPSKRNKRRDDRRDDRAADRREDRNDDRRELHRDDRADDRRDDRNDDRRELCRDKRRRDRYDDRRDRDRDWSHVRDRDSSDLLSTLQRLTFTLFR